MVERPPSPFRNLVNHSQASVSDDGSEEMAISPQPNEGPAVTTPQRNEEPAVTTTLPWYSKTLAFFTMYRELSVALTPKEFGLVRARLRQEWMFDGGFVSWFTIMFVSSQLISHSMYSS